jgi:hypothetical protein
MQKLKCQISKFKVQTNDKCQKCPWILYVLNPEI